jgi:multidrug efflux pump subunit AcrB
MSEKLKEFKPTSWSVDNKTSIYVLSVLLTIFGIWKYFALPKESFPDIVIPTIFVQTINAGTSPSDMEALITKPIEKEIKSISGVKKLKSSSMQDFSIITVEFNTDVEVSDALQKVKDAIGDARSELPDNLTKEPVAKEMDISDMPIMFVNLSGKFDEDKLKFYADELKDRIESLKEITRVDLVGALEKEIQIDLDMYKMQAAKITSNDVRNAVAYENLTMPGGQIETGGMQRSIRVVGEFKNVEQIENIVVRNIMGTHVYLKDIADVKEAHAEKDSYARLGHDKVITLSVIKRSGENLIESSDKIQEIVKDLQKSKFPESLKVVITGDQSKDTRHTVKELINTIIIGFILVVVILMFFMGITNAIFVGLSVPLSCFIAFIVLDGADFSMNMIVLFSFLLALGIVVDDAIVVIENTHRIYDNGKQPIVKAAKQAAGEVFLPVFTGTITTLAPFVPLLFWPGIVGKFMYYMPVTLIITLLASLLVAYIFNPVYAVDFMKPHEEEKRSKSFIENYRGLLIFTVIAGAMGLSFYAGGLIGFGNLLVFFILIAWIYRVLLTGAVKTFQEKTWPKVQRGYEIIIDKTLSGRRPYYLLFGTVALFFVTIAALNVLPLSVVFFPKAEPNYVNISLSMPVGTDVKVTDSVTRIIERRVYQLLGEKNDMVESVITNVAAGAGDQNEGEFGVLSHKSKVSIAFVEYAKRHGKSTREMLETFRKELKGIPGAQITVDQEQNGPPVGKPINIEISGEDYAELAIVSEKYRRYLDSLQIPGIEELKTDLVATKPEVVINIDREKAQREGLSTAQIGNEIRTANYGFEISTFKEGEDEYPIQMRYQVNTRKDLDALMNLPITYMDMAMGGAIRQIPLSSVANYKFVNSYGGIKRKNQKKVITVYSNVLSDYSAYDITQQIKTAEKGFKFPEGVTTDMTGEQAEQEETGKFLMGALGAAICMILLILVLQFNSISKPLMIMSAVIFSVIGVLWGLMIFRMEMSVLMTGVGIVALGGIVVRNGIVLVEFMDELIARGIEPRQAIIDAGKIRMTPVILTATATILGLIPLAIGFNINFVTLFENLNPQIHIGGDSTAFWGPLSWTIIFGLSFATFLTLILVPAMYYIVVRIKEKQRRRKLYKLSQTELSEIGIVQE